MTTAREALHSSASVEWYTPALYIDAAREVMGAIDLDPASCDQANRIVQASCYYTAADDGLRQRWQGRVWLNPPYGRGGQARWSQRLIQEYEAGQVRSAILLVDAATGARWFQPALFPRFATCFKAGRLAFIHAETGKPQTSPTHYNAFVYLGQRPERFAEVFGVLGEVVLPHPPAGRLL